MKRKITISYEWWREDGIEIFPLENRPLEIYAFNIIATELNRNTREGELTLNLNNTPYRGQWKMEGHA